MTRLDSDARHRVELANAKRVVEVPDNANLREALLREGLPLYRGLGRLFNCSGRGRCGTCVVRVVEGAEHLSPRTPFENKRLSGADAALRLACQAQVRGPVVVDSRA
jgi:ferredoxin